MRQTPVENKLRAPHANKRQNGSGTRPHFWTEEPYGCSPLMHCWCGATLTVCYLDQQSRMSAERSIAAMTERLSDFYDEHEYCDPAKSMSNTAEVEQVILH